MDAWQVTAFVCLALAFAATGVGAWSWQQWEDGRGREDAFAGFNDLNRAYAEAFFTAAGVLLVAGAGVMAWRVRATWHR